MGFFKNTWRMWTNRMGDLTGSDFQGCNLGTATKDGAPALMIYGLNREDFIFNKGDVKNISIMETGVILIINNQKYVGNKYKIEFKNGKTALLSMPAGDCYKIEKVLY